MPEQEFETNLYGDFTKDSWTVVNTEQKGARIMSCSGVRSLLLWCRQQTESYTEVNLINMTTSWRDGLAFCAIIHHYRPDLIDFDRLSKENAIENNELAFSVAEKHFGVPMVLDARDMVESGFPDKLSVITYVSQMYEYFKNKTPANQSYATKMKVKPKSRTESKSQKGSKRTSPSNQMYLLSGHAKRVATALRNVFKSDTKEESAKGKDTGQSRTGKYLRQDSTGANLETVRSSTETSPNVTRKSPFLGNDCCICHKRVYIVERLIAERKLFHRACFRCSKCNACLRPGTYHYFHETDKFSCLFDCGGGQKGQKEAPMKIKLEPITSCAQESKSQDITFSKSPSVDDPQSRDLTQQTKGSFQRQFSIVKKNTIQLNALPKPVSKTARSFKHTRSSKTQTKVRQKGEGEKKRRFSGNGLAKNKQEGRGLRMGEQSDQTVASWSPVHKRRAPEKILNEETGNTAVNKKNVNEPSKVLKPMLTALKSDLVSNMDQTKGFKTGEEREKRMSREESVYGLSSENLFSSFKEELLKRATETERRDTCEVEQGTKENKALDSSHASDFAQETGGPDECQKEVVSLGDNVGVESGNLVKDRKEEDSVEERRQSEDGIVRSDLTRRSRKSSRDAEAPAPVASKSVQKLREKFLNIDNLIEEKSKSNKAKKGQEMQRELRCISEWKKCTDSHGEAARKLSMGKMVGKSADPSKPRLRTSRRSVKELRKMYMGNESSDNVSKEKLNLIRSKSMKAAITMEQKSSPSGKEDIISQTLHGEPEEKTDSTVLESKEDHFTQLSKNCDLAEKYSGESEKSFTDTTSNGNALVDGSLENLGNIVFGYEKDGSNSQLPCQTVSFRSEERRTKSKNAQSDGSLENSGNGVFGYEKDGSTPQSLDQTGNLHSEEKRTKSEDAQIEVPSLQIQPASPNPGNGQHHSPGLKRIAASHDSGIDEPPLCGQINSLNNVMDKKISAESLKVAAEFSFPGSGGTDLSLNLQPLKSDPIRKLPSPDVPLTPSPGSDVSPVEVFWSLPLSVGRRTSLTDTSSSCSSPRMSVIIAQEASTTKINSRYFTVESMEPWDFEDNLITEENQCVMEVEGEFSFGREKRRTSKAEREAIYSLHRDAKNLSLNETGLIKQDEITLSPLEIYAELQDLEVKHGLLERKGVEIEHQLRESMDSEGLYSCNEDELLHEWLYVVHERNKILRRDSELIYLLQSHHYEKRYQTVEGELRKLVAMRDEVKSSDDLKRERELLSELLELVQRRSFIVDSLEEERVREIQEDDKVEHALQDGVAASPDNCWDQRPDFTKVAFSRFYC